MNPFEYAQPHSEAEAVALLAEHGGECVVLASGMDLMPLLKQSVVKTKRVVDITRVDSLRGIDPVDGGVTIGVLTTLEDIAHSPILAEYPSLSDVVDGVRAIQVQQSGTLGGDLCHLPNCWYFRSGYGLLARDNGRSLPEVGDNRYHAIFGNAGPAKFVSASRFAPALIAWGAQVRITGPAPDQEQWLPLDQFYAIPKTEYQGVTVLKPGQLLTHVWLPGAANKLSATYEVLEMQGLDWPLASAAATLELEAGRVRRATIVLGHVAPTPWISHPAADVLIGQPVTPQTAQLAGQAAVSEA
ncbi:MAG: xanthine dehydrogenase family protein subunit M, partial [Planctomycetaceae bacterium]